MTDATAARNTPMTRMIRFYKVPANLIQPIKDGLRNESPVAFEKHIGTQINITHKVTVRQLLADFAADGMELVDAYWGSYLAEGQTVWHARPTFVFAEAGSDSVFAKGMLPGGASELLEMCAKVAYYNAYTWRNIFNGDPRDPQSFDTTNMTGLCAHLKPKDQRTFGMGLDGEYYPVTPAEELPAPGTSHKTERLSADPPSDDTTVTVEEE
ncbi:MAG: hypothetical protein WC864_07480 [Ilumatobacteraceae bacterium]